MAIRLPHVAVPLRLTSAHLSIEEPEKICHNKSGLNEEEKLSGPMTAYACGDADLWLLRKGTVVGSG